jgi:hypothetical protein
VGRALAIKPVDTGSPAHVRFTVADSSRVIDTREGANGAVTVTVLGADGKPVWVEVIRPSRGWTRERKAGPPHPSVVSSYRAVLLYQSWDAARVEALWQFHAPKLF